MNLFLFFKYVLLFSTLCFPLRSSAQFKRSVSVENIVPESSAIFLQISDPIKLIEQIEEHPVREKFEAMPVIADALKSPEISGVKFILGLVNLKLGMNWRNALGESASKGLTFIGDPDTDGFALLMESGNQAVQKKTYDTLVELAQQDARKKGNRFEQDAYRGIDVVRIDNLYTARFANMWLMVNKGETGQAILDAYKDYSQGLSANRSFAAKAATYKHTDHNVWGWFDLQALSDLGASKDLYSGKTDNMLGELLFGGLLHTLKDAKVATMDLDLSDDELGIRFHIPVSTSWLPEERSWYDPGPTLKKARLPAPPDTLFSFRLNRDLESFWFASSDLYGERTLAKIAESESQIGLLFGGKDFGADVLSQFGPEMQIVSCRQSFEHHEAHMIPGVKLPAVAAIFRMKDTKRVPRELKQTFHNLVGFLNIVGAQEESIQFEFDMEAFPEGKIHFARPYVSDTELENHEETGAEGGGRIEFNASPSLAFSGEFAILSSTYELAETLLKGGINARETSKDPSHLQAILLGEAGQKILNDNREQLVVSEMLKKGVSRDKASVNIDFLLEVLKWIQYSRFDLRSEDGKMTALLKLKLED